MAVDPAQERGLVRMTTIVVLAQVLEERGLALKIIEEEVAQILSLNQGTALHMVELKALCRSDLGGLYCSESVTNSCYLTLQTSKIVLILAIKIKNNQLT